MLERGVGISSNIIGCFGTLSEIMAVTFLNHLLHLIVAHNTATEDAIICFLSTVHNLSFVSLVHT